MRTFETFTAEISIFIGCVKQWSGYILYIYHGINLVTKKQGIVDLTKIIPFHQLYEISIWSMDFLNSEKRGEKREKGRNIRKIFQKEVKEGKRETFPFFNNFFPPCFMLAGCWYILDHQVPLYQNITNYIKYTSLQLRILMCVIAELISFLWT